MQHFITPETAEYILNLNTSGLTTKEIHELTGLPHLNILNYLRSVGLKPNCSKLTLLQRIRLRYAFDKGMNEVEAADYAGISQPSVSKHYREWSYNPDNKRGIPPITGYQRRRLRTANRRHMSIPEAAEYANASETAVRKYWALDGLKPYYKQGFPNKKIKAMREAKTKSLEDKLE
jgi:hypothetical protein